jgi:hypothetical protein
MALLDVTDDVGYHRVPRLILAISLPSKTARKQGWEHETMLMGSSAAKKATREIECSFILITSDQLVYMHNQNESRVQANKKKIYGVLRRPKTQGNLKNSF